MKCPLIMAGWNATRAGDLSYPPDCVKENCAWWEKHGVRCSIMSLVERLGWIERAINDLEEKLTKGGKA